MRTFGKLHFGRTGRTTWRPRRLVLPLVIAAAALAIPMWALASHQFSDVPSSNPFHSDISAIADAGVTGGCGGGKYCPQGYVTREQMAAFMNRLGALGPGKQPVVNATKLDGLDSTEFMAKTDAIDADTLGGLDPASFARSDQMQHYSCAGSDMQPISSATSYDGTIGFRFITAGYGVLTCPIHLPDSATVVGFTGWISDATSSYEGHCGLYRTQPGGPLVPMAATPGSGVAATQALAVLEAPSIASPQVDNELHAYTAWCDGYGAAGEDLAVSKVTVDYIGAP